MSEELKKQVHNFWDQGSCGTEHTSQSKHSLEYFEEIEKVRYTMEPEIFSFAQFSRAFGKKVLEVGIGAGTDFLQWVRSGAEAYGVDLTKESVENVQKRLEVYGLKAQDIQVADCENLPHPDGFFDLVYSWGVIHHTPNTYKALDEIIRVCKPGGEIKVMIYNKHSVNTYMVWLTKALLRGRPWKSLDWALFHYMESPGTKGYTIKEIERHLQSKGLKNIEVKAQLGFHDYSSNYYLLRLLRKTLCRVLGDKHGWFLTFTVTK